MKILSRLLLLCVFGCGTVLAQSTSAVVNTSSCEKPEYPAMSKRLEEEGTVQLKFLVGTDGKVIESAVEKSSGFLRLDDAARQGLLKCQFKPASVGGIPQQSWASMKYTWRLETKTANSPNQCPPQLRLSAGYGCLYDYRFTSQKDIETSREVGQVAAQSPIGYVITAAKDKNCNSISIKSITSSNSGDDSIARSLSACQKNGCECSILVNNGIVVDQNLFSKYANSTTQVTSNQPESSPINNVPLAIESNLPACLGAGFGHNCWGTVTDANGTKYVGEFQNYQRRGQGIEYSQSGTVLRSGTWLRNLVSAHPIETSRFPFNTSTQNQTVAVNNQSANDTSRVERDRLALEVELERRKRQELEEQLKVAQQQSAKPTSSYGIERRVARYNL
jgi:TonB family protein